MMYWDGLTPDKALSNIILKVENYEFIDDLPLDSNPPSPSSMRLKSLVLTYLFAPIVPMEILILHNATFPLSGQKNFPTLCV